MAIDFTLTPQQRALQLESRQFAADVLARAKATELLPTPEERFLATSLSTKPWWQPASFGNAFRLRPVERTPA
jgi:hypothetical protein